MTITTSGTTLTFNDGTTMTTVVFPSGTAMLFQQTAAPTGWTKSTTYNDYAIRIVNGTASTGGSVAFTTAFKSQSVTGTNSGGSVSATSLSTGQLANHSHGLGVGFGGCGSGAISWRACCQVVYSTRATGCGGSHSHGFTNPTFSGTAINLAVNYVDHIIATKN
jgi:hypothetical protein